MAERPYKLGSFAPGVNNRLEPTQLATVMPDRTRGTYLYGGDNVDLNDKGYAKRRRGKTAVFSGRAHSVWADKLGAFVVIDETLTALSESGAGLARTAVRAGMPLLPISYSRGADGDVYWSNGQAIRRVTAGQDRPVATPAPQDPGPADIVVGTGGALAAGKYLLAYTAIGPDGESPATTAVQLDVPAGGDILIAGIQHVYMSGPNGDILTYQGRTNRVYTHNANGRVCSTLNTAAMPAGSIVRHFQGRMLVAVGNTLLFSLPYNYGVYDPAAGYIPLPADIAVVEPTDNGVYICADKTYWLGNVTEAALPELLPYGAIPGSSGQSPNGNEVFWQTEHGLVIGDKNGTVKNVQEDALEFSAASSGASLFRQRDGSTHIVTSRAGAQPSTGGAISFADAEVVRRGTTL